MSFGGSGGRGFGSAGLGIPKHRLLQRTAMTLDVVAKGKS